MLVVDCGTIDIGAHTVRRWLNLEHEVAHLFELFKPELVIIEENFVFRNPRSTAMLNQLRGVIMLLCAQRGIATEIIDNNTAKKYVLGGTRYWDGTRYVSVTKEMMQEAVKESLCGNSAIPQDSDSADAVALALAYYKSPVSPHHLARRPTSVKTKSGKNTKNHS